MSDKKIKFVYRGKKSNFKLGDAYQFKGVLNPGQEFELEGNDVKLLGNCMKIAEINGTSREEATFILLSEKIAAEERKAFESDMPKVEEPVRNNAAETGPGPDQPQESDQDGPVYTNDEDIKEEKETTPAAVDLKMLKKEELMQICKDKNIKFSENAKRVELIQLIKNN